MATAAPQRRPLVLLHKCTECATFALAPIPVLERKNMDIDRIRLKFSQVLGFNSSNRAGGKDLDGDGDDDSAYCSNASGQSSPDDSPVSRSDSPSPIDKNFGAVKDELVHRPQNPFRYRSMSESGEQIKGILKRRPTILRSLSQCDEGKAMTHNRSTSTESQSLESSNDDGLDQSCDDDDFQRERSQSIKKTVRFNDRVQENVFRPNSSILGQRKKNQKKQQRKRRRTESGDSQTGDSEHENNDQIDQDVNGNEMDDKDEEKTKEMTDPKPIDAAQNTEDKDKSSTKPDGRKKEKVQRQQAVIGDKRYDGFVMGNEKKVKARPLNHRRHSSGDSGLGDDEGEGETDQVQNLPPPAPSSKSSSKKNRRRRTVSCGDSGLDE